MSNQTEIVMLEIMPVEIQQAATQLGMPLDQAGNLFAPFAPLYAEAGKLLAASKPITEPKAAREMRLKLVKSRTAIAKAKDTAKADILRNGKAIDGFNNIAKAMIEPEEERLDAIEKADERRIAKEREELKTARMAELANLGVDGQFYSLDIMPDVAFADLLNQVKVAHQVKMEQAAAAIEAERVAAEKAEAERVAREKAEHEERERIKAENARLKAERDAAEAAAKVERERVAKEAAEAAAKAKAERDAIEAKARAERDAIEAKAKAEREDIERKAAQERALAEAAAKVERAKREALELSERNRLAAEAKRQAEEVEAAKKAAAAPDRTKLAVLADLIESITEPEGLTTTSGQLLSNQAIERLATLANYVRIQCNNL
jgi:hypothetical protein